MRAPLHGVDVVHKAADVLGIGVVVLQGDLQPNPIPLPLEKDRPVQGVAAFVQVFHKRLEAPLVVKRLLVSHPDVFQDNGDVAVEKCHFAHPVDHGFQVEDDGFEDRIVRHKGRFGARLIPVPDLFHLG